MDQFLSLDFETEESRKLDRPTKKDKRDQKDLEYQSQKKQIREHFKMKKKEKHQQQMSKFINEEDRQKFIDQKKLEKKNQRQKAQEAMESSLTIIIDCAFEELMDERETKSLARQITELYSENRNLLNPVQLKLSGVYPKLKYYLDQQGFENWMIKWSEDEFYNEEDVKNPIYMTPDAEDELQSVEGTETFIIGGLVDRRIVKNATLNRSRLIGVKAVKLPISNMIKANFKKALNVSTAALMIPAYLQYKDWTQVFESVVPKKFSKQENEKQ